MVRTFDEFPIDYPKGEEAAGPAVAPPPSGRMMILGVALGRQELPRSLRQELALAHGFVIREEARSLLVAFENPTAGVLWALDLLELLPLAVGAHLGLCLFAEHEGAGHRCVGDTGEWAMGLAFLAPKGRLLVTSAVWGAVKDGLRRQRRIGMVSLGEQRLPGLEGRYRVLSLAGEDAPEAEFSLPTCGRTNLPESVAGFVGREGPMSALASLFEQGRSFVSIFGPGGAGKSRLALRYAAMQVEDFCHAGGVWVCDLSEARSIDALVSAVARALRIPLSSGGLKGLNQVGHAMSSLGELLLVLDGFELVGDKGLLALDQWQRHAPNVRFLVTSRVRLQPPGQCVELGSLEEEGAVLLFGLRASEVHARFDLMAHRDAIQRIVQLLEGLPMAIELAASWLSLMSPESILVRLSESLRFLSGAPNSGGRTMGRVISWSWDLLEHGERSAMAQCSVFRGGFSLDAAQGVIDLSSQSSGLSHLDLLMSLRDKSLIHPAITDSTGSLRFQMYELVRDFSEQKAVSFGLYRLAAHRHATWFLQQGRRWRDQIRGSTGLAALGNLARERENLLAAFRYASRFDANTAVEIILIVQPLYEARGPFEQSMTLLDEAVEISNGSARELRVRIRCARADALLTRGAYERARADLELAQEELLEMERQDTTLLHAMLHLRLGMLETRVADYEVAESYFSEAIRQFQESGDTFGVSDALGELARLQFQVGRWEESATTFREALLQLRGLGDQRGEGVLAAAFGNLHRARGEDASSLYARALAAHEEAEDLPGQARVLGFLGGMAIDNGEADEAVGYYQRALTLCRRVGDVHGAALSQGNLGRVHHQEGRLSQAQSAYQEALLALDGLNDRRFASIFRSNVGAVHHELGQLEEARRVYEEALTAIQALGDPRFEGLILGRLAVAMADLGFAPLARETLVQGGDRMSFVGDPGGKAVLRIHLAHLEVAEGRHRSSEAVRKMVRQATMTRKLSSWDLRIALRLLRQALRRG
ncbi:MAG: tetratricopeptide repeat protein [Deltaproteobacteria bacterium]|nr:tetratricopeptide repeat protein [Deltaproteobacteria bacterium]